MKQTMIVLIAMTSLIADATEHTFGFEKDQIKKMAGCYEVVFQFAETFARTEGYKTKAPYTAKALELVVVDEETSKSVELQHILMIGRGRMLKHWRQEWHYEPNTNWNFLGDRVWEKQDLTLGQSQGAWQQIVTQVDDSPRYSCTNSWSLTPKRSFWECESWNPLPRREYSKRSDYNVLQRRNRHEITNYGWVHEQDNEKIIAIDGVAKSVLAEEKGKNLYKKVDDAKCQEASSWWAQNKPAWDQIRLAWDAVHAKRDRMELAASQRPLWMQLFQLAKKANDESWTSEDTYQRALELINRHIK